MCDITGGTWKHLRQQWQSQRRQIQKKKIPQKNLLLVQPTWSETYPRKTTQVHPIFTTLVLLLQGKFSNNDSNNEVSAALLGDCVTGTQWGRETVQTYTRSDDASKNKKGINSETRQEPRAFTESSVQCDHHLSFYSQSKERAGRCMSTRADVLMTRMQE